MLTRGVPCCPGKSCQKHEKNPVPFGTGLARASWGFAQIAVGETGFEPAASCSQSKRATKLRHSPAHSEISGRRADVQPG